MPHPTSRRRRVTSPRCDGLTRVHPFRLCSVHVFGRLRHSYLLGTPAILARPSAICFVASGRPAFRAALPISLSFVSSVK